MSPVSIESLQAQEMDVRAGSNDVEVDRGGVDGAVRSLQQSSTTDRLMDAQIATWLLIDQRGEAQRPEVANARRDGDGVQRPRESIVDRVEEGIKHVADHTEQVLDNSRDAVIRGLTPERTRQAHGNLPWVEIHDQIASKVSQVARQNLEGRQGYELAHLELFATKLK